MKTESFKLKVDNRQDLYYKKYLYRVNIHAPGLRFLHGKHSPHTVDEIKERVLSFINIPRLKEAIAKMTDDDYAALVKIQEAIADITKAETGTVRREMNNVSFYTNDDAVVKTLSDSFPSAKITKANPSPSEIKYFSRTPPAKYRFYFRNAMVSVDVAKSLREYINSNADLSPNGGLYKWMMSALGIFAHTRWISNTYYVDSDDDRHALMMKLKFPEVMGKIYKLEKRPE